MEQPSDHDEERKRYLALHQKEREVGFANEAFTITVLHLTSGGALIALLGQAQTLVDLATRPGFAWLVTLTSLSLSGAVLAAYWKHLYKMWDIKARVQRLRVEKPENLVQMAGVLQEAERRSNKANRYLKWMRRAMTASAIIFAADAVLVLVLVWRWALAPPAAIVGL